jgi:glycosyltransferase involved in cell wall biosynthesis
MTGPAIAFEPSAVTGARAPAAPLRICVVAHLAYGSISGSAGHIGGVEYQTSLLARWLAGRGHDVTLLTWDEGQPPELRIARVRVRKLCRREDGWPIIRFVHPRWSSLAQALRAADADLYYQNGAECVTGQLALWCRSRRRRFAFSTASNADCDSRLPLLPTWRERALYRVGLRLADQVIVQTVMQQRLLLAAFGRESTVLPLPSPEPAAPAGDGARHRILWIGRICEVKRPDRFVDLARRCPDLTFDLVGPTDGSAYARHLLARARAQPNVRVHGGLSRESIGALLDQARCLCCTSDIEGFPNTFLEAWSRSVPLLTTFDPDGIVAERGAGWVARPDELGPTLRRVLTDETAWSAAGRRARAHYLAHHTVDGVLPRFEMLFSQLSGGRRP